MGEGERGGKGKGGGGKEGRKGGGKGFKVLEGEEGWIPGGVGGEEKREILTQLNR